MKPLKRIPNKVWKLLRSPKRWTKHFHARNKKGNAVYASSPQAVSFCLIGAIRKVYPYGSRFKVINKLERNLTCSSIITFNDHPATTHEQVLDLVKKLDI